MEKHETEEEKKEIDQKMGKTQKGGRKQEGKKVNIFGENKWDSETFVRMLQFPSCFLLCVVCCLFVFVSVSPAGREAVQTHTGASGGICCRGRKDQREGGV
jgi:hypothetical protein